MRARPNLTFKNAGHDQERPLAASRLATLTARDALGAQAAGVGEDKVFPVPREESARSGGTVSDKARLATEALTRANQQDVFRSL